MQLYCKFAIQLYTAGAAQQLEHCSLSVPAALLFCDLRSGDRIRHGGAPASTVAREPWTDGAGAPRTSEVRFKRLRLNLTT